ncbi:uncharacterized protein Dsimw501_GD27088 [Drosophila simulans]|uniref:Acp8 n=1 Tax=Drosophila simulans TaxID=7240 RepID=A0A0J9R2G1_DROSI|nr:uncharacterized protein Dsimw501_GD27088 [Drosophila simulans]
MDLKCCLLLLSLLFAGALGRPEPDAPRPTLPPCSPWCAGQPPPPPGAVN